MIRQVSEFAEQIAAAIFQKNHAMSEISTAIAEVARGSKDISTTLSEISISAEKSAGRASHVQDGA